MVNITGLLSTLITANHILSYHNVLDSFGHISVRNPNTNTTFFIALQLGKSDHTSQRSNPYLSFPQAQQLSLDPKTLAST